MKTEMPKQIFVAPLRGCDSKGYGAWYPTNMTNGDPSIPNVNLTAYIRADLPNLKSTPAKYTFEMNGVEAARFDQFAKEHRKMCPVRTDFFWQVRFGQGSLGHKVEVVCGQCGKTKDVTDYASW